jgi:hypothetical protein
MVLPDGIRGGRRCCSLRPVEAIRTTLQHFEVETLKADRPADARVDGSSLLTQRRAELAAGMQERLAQLRAAAARPLWHPKECPRRQLGPRALALPYKCLEAQRASFDAVVHNGQLELG